MRRLRLLAALAPLLLVPALVGNAPAHARPTGPVTVSATGRSVTVDQTTDLVDQTVHVSWKGFTPSSAAKLVPASTMYVVRVYQCRGDAPTSPKDCYGSSLYTYDGQSSHNDILPDGPTNYRDATTSPDGTGGAEIEVRTTLESSTLGCTATTACSLVIVPNNGDPTQPGNDFINATNANMDKPWAWKNHIAVPLHLAPTGAVCPLGVPGVTTIGSPMLQRSFTSWQPAACSAASPVAIDYTALAEPEARVKYLAGGADVGLTTLPASADDGSRPTAYAPLAVSGVTVAFHIDDPITGQPIPSISLTPRLIAKLITESYGGVGYVAPGAPVGKGNPATAGNPYSIYSDKEFLALNPGHFWPTTNSTNPLLVSGNTDLVHELTRWLGADPATRAWLDGTPDEYGMHVNTNFTGIDYPASSLETRDPYPQDAYTFVPINGLDHVARALVSDTPSSSSPTEDPVTHTHAKDPQQLPGSRGLIAIIDTADAAAFSLPEAALQNAGGAFVTPTAASLTAAETHMQVDDRTGTRTTDVTSTDKAAYPLAMVQYAMLPTGDLDAAKTDQVLRFLAYAGGPGQLPGHDTGQLPGGYLPLPTDLQAQLASATTAVRTQSGHPADTTPSPTTTTTSGGGSGQVPSGSVPGGGRLPTGTSGQQPQAVAGPATTSAAATTRTQALKPASFPGTPGQKGPTGLLLPGILLLTLLGGLGGPLLLTRGTAARAVLAGHGRRLWARWSR